MTIPELNERAARLCGRKLVEHFEEWDVELRMVISQTVEFNPCTSPADCAVVMEAMDRPIGKDEWPTYSLVLERMYDYYRATYYQNVSVSWLREDWEWSRATTWTHAVTLAAVRAVEGATK